MRTLLLGIVGAIIGGAAGSLGAALVGFTVGALWGQLSAVGERLNAIGGRLRDLEREVRNLEKPAPTPMTPPIPARETGIDTRPAVLAPDVVTSQVPAPGPPLVPPAAAIPPRPSQPAAEVSRDQRVPAADKPIGLPEPVTAGIGWIIDFFTTGNVVVKVGVIILFFGVGFLIRFAAERGVLPIEYRLMGVTAGALVMLGIGWRLRRSRPDYATALQGGAVGMLYLIIFAAFRLYELLPALLTFSLLLLVVVLSGALAVLQNAMALAVLGTGGGFLAPILASTGSGSHVGLFSYYLLLNAGVVGLAWFRSWRLLNWLGFVFTFGIGFVWGAQYYQPAFFRTTEPFLIVFFLFYVTVAVLFAHRQPPRLRGYIDGSLVFGTPAIAFAMQSALVRDMPFARAYSAVVVSALYLLLARTLWRRDVALRALAEAFVALGVVFLTLAIPLAFDGHGTAAAWALEGAGLLWVGVRQQRVVARAFATLLQIGAGLAFALMATTSVSDLPILNSTFLGCVAIAVGGVASARQYFKARDIRQHWEAPLEWTLLVWGLLWWSGAVEREIDRFVEPEFYLQALVVSVAASGLVLSTLARLWEWPTLMHATTPVFPLSALMALAAYLDDGRPGPWSNSGWLAWPVAVGASYVLLWRFESTWQSFIVRAWHAGTAALLVFLLTWAGAAMVDQLVLDSSTWGHAMWAVVPSLAVLALLYYGHLISWPVERFRRLYVTLVPVAPAACIALWIVWACSQSGEATPLPYVPVVNPIEIAQALGLITIYAWTRVWDGEEFHAAMTRLVRPGVAVLAFLALNAVVGRIVHFYLDVPYDLGALTESATFQAGLSVLWALTALSVMTLAGRRGERNVWFVGAGLLGILTLKLFLVDLDNVGGVARIISFIVTGVLILVIGYVSPLPPKVERMTT